MTDARPIALETLLLEHGDFVRRLTQAMVHDPGEREDVAQEVWLAAVERPPEGMGSIRSWLARVARNVVGRNRREARRRKARERRVARAESTSPADESGDRAAVIRELIETVSSLEEPYRRVILQRYYEGLPPREIANREGLSPATVRTRLWRAREHLRRALDAKHGGDRRTWIGVLLPVAGAKATSASLSVALAKGVVAMGLKLNVVAAGVVIVAGLATFWFVQGGEPSRDLPAFVQEKRDETKPSPKPQPSTAAERPAAGDARPPLEESSGETKGEHGTAPLPETPPRDLTQAPRGMVLIPGGSFLMGTTREEAAAIVEAFRMDQRQRERFRKRVNTELVAPHRRRVSLEPFYIDRYEVTNLQYSWFRKSTGAPAPELPSDHPARWRGGRLPGSTQLYFVDEVRSWPGLIDRIRGGKPAKNEKTPAGRIWKLLDEALKQQLGRIENAEQDIGPELKSALLSELNRMLKRRDFYEARYFHGHRLTREEVALRDKGLSNLNPDELMRFNRLQIDRAFASSVEPGQPPTAMLLPVTGVTWFQVRSCAEWMGKRLPTEREWEKAARGTADARLYPWGDRFVKDACNWALHPISRLDARPRQSGLRPVDTHPKGASVYGVHDLIGNAIELTADSWKPHENAVKDGSIDFVPIGSSNLAVIKGGAYGEQFEENLRISCRYGFYKSEATEAIGFRGAKDVQLGRSVLARIANELFSSVWDARLVKLDFERGVAGREWIRYDERFPRLGIVTGYRWIGFVNIEGHLFDSRSSLRTASEKVRRKNDGRVFLGVLHTDLGFQKPDLDPGSYAIVFQKAFKTGAPDPARPVPRFADVDRLLFLDAGGRIAAAVEAPPMRKIRSRSETARLTLHPAAGGRSAYVTLHFAMRRKYEALQFLTFDLVLSDLVDGGPTDR